MATVIDPATGQEFSLEFDPEPTFMGTDEAARTNTTAASATGPQFMSDDWDEEDPVIMPALMPVAGGLPLLYAGQSHMLYGQGGEGKSWLGYLVCADTARTGGIVVIVDYESNRATIKARLKALGVTKEHASRIAYWKVTASLMPASPARVALDAFLEKWPTSFLLLDSIAKAMGAAGFDESNNAEYVKWQQAVVEPWTYRNVTSLLIDHIGHQAEGVMRKQKVAARGASAKTDQVSGASYFFEAKQVWTRTNDGHGTLTCVKDREGHRKKWSLAANVNVAVAGNGAHVDITLSAPQEMAKDASGKPRRTWFMELVSKYLEDCDRAAATSSQMEKYVASLGKSKGFAGDALKTLVEEGFVRKGAPEGGRGTVYLTVVKPYRAAEDPTSDSTPPAAPTGVGFGGGGASVVRPDYF